METLAQIAASHNDTSAIDGETYIEKYIKGISAVESILTLDRLRQVRFGYEEDNNSRYSRHLVGKILIFRRWIKAEICSRLESLMRLKQTQKKLHNN